MEKKDIKLPKFNTIEELASFLFISEKKLETYLSPNIRLKEYRSFKIPKRKRNEVREIDTPKKPLMDIQKRILKKILVNIPVSNCCNSYVKNRSIVNNAQSHVGAKILLKFDIENFFSNIDFNKVCYQFRYWGYNKDIARYLTCLCINGSNYLPQGAPTSPMISNIIMNKIDKSLYTYCIKRGYIYTRYADDITISSKNILNYKQINEIKWFVKKILKDRINDFKLNDKKTKIITSKDRMVVTGLIVNDVLNVNRSKIREVENAIRYIKRYGIVDHLKHINCEKSFYKEHIFGLALYIKMIDENKGLKLLNELKEIEWTDDKY